MRKLDAPRNRHACVNAAFYWRTDEAPDVQKCPIFKCMTLLKGSPLLNSVYVPVSLTI